MHLNVYFLSSVAGIVAVIWEALRTYRRVHTHNIEEIVTRAITDALVPLHASINHNDNRLVVLETKMDLVINGVASNAAAILHHPEPSRGRIDYLLDLFNEGTITDVECEELRQNLDLIMHWDSGQEAPYKIFPGEQAAAGLLLATMDHVVTPEDTHGLPDTDAGSTEDTGT